jgi:hypothetical protein
LYLNINLLMQSVRMADVNRVLLLEPHFGGVFFALGILPDAVLASEE